MHDQQVLTDPKMLVRDELKRAGLDLDTINIPRRVFIAMSGIIEEFLDQDAVLESDIPLAGKLYIFKNNPAVGLIKSHVGSPGIAIQAEDLIAAGVKELIHLGYVGGIDPDLIPGRLIVTTGAFNETGIAKLYGFDDEIIYPDQTLANEMKEMLNKQGLEFIDGHHWTTDAGYLETWGKVKKYRSQGALCVEMEAVGLFTVANYRGIKSAAIYVVSDVLTEVGWSLGWSAGDIDKGVTELVKVILKDAQLN
ncbi:nucleoside phosphorylase [Paenibacillus marinisediminis]